MPGPNRWHPDTTTQALSVQFVNANGEFVGKAVVAATGSLRLVGGAVVYIPPTTDPAVAGAVWNNGGVLAISA